jgi:hypothetical protein
MMRGLARGLGSKSGGVLDRHFVEKLFLVTGVHAIRKLDLAKIRQLDRDGVLLFIIFDRVQLAEKIGRDGGEGGSRSGSWTKLSASRLPASFSGSDKQISLRGHAGLNKGLGESKEMRGKREGSKPVVCRYCELVVTSIS